MGTINKNRDVNPPKKFGTLLEALADILTGRRRSRAEMLELLAMDEFEEAGCELHSSHGEPIGVFIPIRRDRVG